MAPEKYLFIDNVRFWAISAVVALHTAGGVAGTLHTTATTLVFATEDLLKFGTIGFFLVSGFLLGDRFQSSPRRLFFARRLRKVFLPWLFWFTIQVAYFLFGRIHLHGEPFTPRLIAHVAASCLVATAFWFVPSLFISVAVLSLFRPLLHDLRVGFALLAISLFYAVNVYGHWLPPSHTIAPLGFVFYLWLGALASRHQSHLLHFLTRVPALLLATPMVVAAAASMTETHLLTQLHSSDPTNSLRITNQLYSVAVFLLLMKPRRRAWPAFVDVRSDIFGVYLTLTLVLALFETSASHLLLYLPGSSLLHSRFAFVALSAAATAVIAGLCLALTRLCARHRHLAWIVGVRPFAPSPSPRRHQRNPELSDPGIAAR